MPAMSKRILTLGLFYIISFHCGYSQSFEEKYRHFQQSTQNTYHSFRDECNLKYAQFLRFSWGLLKVSIFFFERLRITTMKRDYIE